LGVASQITPYSYRKGNTCFLEEDLDAGTYLKARKSAGYSEPTTRSSYEEQSFVRSLDPYYSGEDR
jgi:hypothetical protein